MRKYYCRYCRLTINYKSSKKLIRRILHYFYGYFFFFYFMLQFFKAIFFIFVCAKNGNIFKKWEKKISNYSIDCLISASLNNRNDNKDTNELTTTQWADKIGIKAKQAVKKIGAVMKAEDSILECKGTK